MVTPKRAAVLLALGVVTGVLAGALLGACEAQGSSPNNPVYYECVEGR